MTIPSLKDFQALQHAVELAVADARAGAPAATYDVSIVVRDEGGQSGDPDPQLGAFNAADFVAEASVIGLIGGGTSAIAEQQIPVTNAAGLLHCSPTNTRPEPDQTARRGAGPAFGVPHSDQLHPTASSRRY